MNSFKQTIKNIQSIKIQGASNICRTSLAAWQTHLINLKIKRVDVYLEEAYRIGRCLLNARPNEPLTVNALNYLNKRLQDSVKIRDIIIGINDMKKLTRQYVEDFFALLHDIDQKITEHGSKFIKNKENIFIHCHSRTVENILIRAKKEYKKKFHVYNDETRPLFQGRITSKSLIKNKIPNTMVVDPAAPFLVSDASGDDIKIHRVFLGFDVILPDGSALNKIGSFGIALTAYDSKIPIYLCGSLLKYSPDKKMKIELRRSSEIWPHRPKKLEIINYAFDRIPAKFILGYITEFGIIKPNDMENVVKKNYRWIINKYINGR
ncbi:hypothetical protein COV56_00735 [Candidatus Kuenenbacteria bacterium CG11_big_fil_rev_8_21_14_0_20_37_9]|nr:MAG: hypothetical protein COV56_00735 [Candidatus Kuenenbacteria bacterium CG11_big_fil_rev_8_21_14_0_20_37_9]